MIKHYAMMKFFAFMAVIFLTQPVYSGEDIKRAIPRFASIRSDKVNLRRGPGTQYPTDWVYVRGSLPIEIIAEYGAWRKIRDHEGTEGWVHQAMLSGRRHIIVTASKANFYKNASMDPDNIVAIAERDVIGRVLECTPQACKAQFASYKGWINRADFWGVRPQEEKIK